MNTFMSSLDRRLEPMVKTHLKRVYSTLTISVLSASIGSYVHLYTHLAHTIGGIFSFILMTGLMLAIYSTPDDGKNSLKRLCYLLGFSFLSGLNLGPLIELSLFINPNILPTAFISTAIIFGCFTMSSIFGDRRKTLYFGGLLSSGLTLLIFMGLFNRFIDSELLYKTYFYLGFAIMCAFVVYDTALIIEKRLRGDTDYIGHAILLFIDMINIFRYVLVLLSEKENNSRKKKRNN